MLTKVVSGGQSGVDAAALVAARECGFETGGWVPQGWATEKGPLPLLMLFGLREHPSSSYSVRTKANVADSDGTLIIVKRIEEVTGGTKLAMDTAKALGRRFGLVELRGYIPQFEEAVVTWIVKRGIGTLNVAGPRESRSPGIEEAVQEFLVGVFRRLRQVEGGGN